MTRPTGHSNADRPLLRGICLVVKGNGPSRDRRQPATGGTVPKFPGRPDPSILSKSIPLFFVGRNRNGLWIAREAEGRTGGVFLFKRSALRFAHENSVPMGGATMFLAKSFELDVENRGNPSVAWLDAALSAVNRFIPAYPPAIPIGRKNNKGVWQ
jgi:hypothetical protein